MEKSLQGSPPWRDELTVLKAGAVWIDGKPHGLRPFANNTSADLRREACIYKALGLHEQITIFIRLEEHQDTGEAWTLRLERAPLGSLRKYVVQYSSPPMYGRLGIAIDFSKGVKYLHDCGVLWGDLSTRNALVVD